MRVEFDIRRRVPSPRCETEVAKRVEIWDGHVAADLKICLRLLELLDGGRDLQLGLRRRDRGVLYGNFVTRYVDRNVPGHGHRILAPTDDVKRLKRQSSLISARHQVEGKLHAEILSTNVDLLRPRIE